MRTRTPLAVVSFFAFAPLVLGACGGGGGGGASLGVDSDSGADGGDTGGRASDAAHDGRSSTDALLGSDGKTSADSDVTHDGGNVDTDAGGAEGGSGTDAAHEDAGRDGSAGSDGSSTDATHDGTSMHDAASMLDAAGHDAGGGTGTCGFCTTPPAPECASSATLQSFASMGTCVAGACVYTSSMTACTNGCANGACTGSGWTTMNSSTAADLYAAWGSSASDVWAVGGSGVAVHYDGTSWTVESPPGTTFLESVSGSGPNDVYTCDPEGNTYHFDGTGWAAVAGLFPSGPYEVGLGVGAPGSVWLAGHLDVQMGENPVITTALYPSNGVTLGMSQSDDAAYVDDAPASGATVVLALSSTNIWVAGSPLSHSNGTTLTESAGYGAVAFWAASASDVFAASGGGSVNIWNGTTWSASNTGSLAATSGVWGTAANRVFAVTFGGQDGIQNVGEVRSYNGIGWANETLPANTGSLYAVYAAPTGEVFAVGANGTIIEGP